MTNNADTKTLDLYLADGSLRTFTVGEHVTFYAGGTRADVTILGFPDGLVEWSYLGSGIAHVSLGAVFVKGLTRTPRPWYEVNRAA